MVKIVKENGMIWAVETSESYGVKHISKAFLGYEEKPKKKKTKKEDEA